MKCFLSFFIFCLSLQCVVYAQSGDVASKEPWQLVRAISNNLRDDGSFSKAIVKFKDKVAFAVNYSKDKCGVALVDTTGKIIWETSVEGYILSLSKMEDRIVVFCTPDWEDIYDEHTISKIVAVSMDIEKGSIVAEKEILHNSTDNYIDIKIDAAPDESLTYVLLRYTDYKSKRLFAGSFKYPNIRASDRVELVGIKKDLAFTTTQINSKVVQGVFLSCTTMHDGTFALLSKVKENVVAEKFRIGQAEPTDQLTLEAGLFNKGTINVYSLKDPAIPDRLWISFGSKKDKGDKAIKIVGIDWTEKKMLSQEIVLNGDLKKVLKTQNKDLSGNTRRHLEEVIPVGIYASNDKIVLISQVYYVTVSPSNGGRSDINPYYGDILVAVFNRQLINEGYLVLPRECPIRLGRGENIGAEIIGNKLHVMYSCIIKTIESSFRQVDLTSLKVENEYFIQRSLMPGEKEYRPGDALIFFYGNIIRPFYTNRTQITKDWINMVRKVRD